MGQIGRIPTVEQQIVGVLAGHGWLVACGSALAYKTYHTAVGPKQALAYLEDWAGCSNFMLKGDYWSEGRNVLAAHAVLIPKTADVGAVSRLANQFAADTDKVVAGTYAARLARIPD